MRRFAPIPHDIRECVVIGKKTRTKTGPHPTPYPERMPGSVRHTGGPPVGAGCAARYPSYRIVPARSRAGQPVGCGWCPGRGRRGCSPARHRRNLNACTHISITEKQRNQLYTLYIDESGDEGPPGDSIHSQWFTTGGIIVDDDGRRRFEQAHDRIIMEHFAGKGIALPGKFKLHYSELREDREPYRQLGNGRRRVADDVFAAIKDIDCSLVSASINKVSHRKRYADPFGVRAYTLLACRQRFQRFLEERDDTGRIVYERFTTAQRRKIMPEMRELQDSVAWRFSPNLYKIKSRIGSGNPLVERALQFADFFVYAPHIMLVTGKKKRSRFEEIRHKYYNFDGAWRERGFVVID